MSYDGQVLDRTTVATWMHVSINHPSAAEKAERLGEELDAQGVVRWKIGVKNSRRILLALRIERTTSRTLRRSHSIFKTWLSPLVSVADDRDWIEGPVRSALARVGLSGAQCTVQYESVPVTVADPATSGVGH